MPTRSQRDDEVGSWIVRDVPRDLMRKMKIAAAIQETSIRQLLIDLSEAHTKALEKRGLLPKGKL